MALPVHAHRHRCGLGVRESGVDGGVLFAAAAAASAATASARAEASVASAAVDAARNAA
jgi:hypothetical protein